MKYLKLFKKELFEIHKINNFKIKKIFTPNNLKTLFIIEINSIDYKVISKSKIRYLDETKAWLDSLHLNEDKFYSILTNKFNDFYKNSLTKYRFISQIKYETTNFYVCEYFPEYVKLKNKHFILDNKSLYLKYLIFGESIITLDIIKKSKLYNDIANSILHLIKNEEIHDDTFKCKFYDLLKKSNNFGNKEWISQKNISVLPSTHAIINYHNNIFSYDDNNNIMVKIKNNRVIDWKITDIEFVLAPMPSNQIS